MKIMKILVIDDDDGLRRSLDLILDDAGYEIVSAENAEEGLAKAAAHDPDLVMVDLRMPGLDGLGFLERYRETKGTAPVILMTAYGSTDLAIQAVRQGAADFLPKPFGASELLMALKKVEERERILRGGLVRGEGGGEDDGSEGVRETQPDGEVEEIVARSPGMVRALEVATRVARHSTSVLLTGPTGTGKELFARLIHRESDRAGQPFIPVNCGAIPEGLLESEFFGHMKGAFSGAESDREGLFEAADGGTLFLDEVGELPEALQVKLLRVLQEGEVRRLGDTRTRDVDVRVVAATNRSLEQEVQEGRFREDLFYRIAVLTVDLPPLRERLEDVPHLIRYLFERHRKRLGVQVEGVAPETMDVLKSYPWPGNVRELENVLERALVLADGPRVRPEDLPPMVRSPALRGESISGSAGTDDPSSDLSVKRRGAELEKELIKAALERTGGHRGNAARLLDLSDRALRYKIQEYELEAD